MAIGCYPLPPGYDTVTRYVAFTYSFKNVGKSPAWITAAAATLIKVADLKSLPPEPDYPQSTIDTDIPVAPDAPTGAVTQPLHLA